jgi:signal transduction histidine kinase
MKSGGRLRVRVAPGRSWHRSETRGIRVTVADSGAGIPVELRKRVFEPFVSSKESFGTGLGLWVSEDIVKKHKGTIAFRSSTEAERHGTVFSVFLPLTNQP